MIRDRWILTVFSAIPSFPALENGGHEGAEIGYRWLAKTGAAPLYPFGHGLSYGNLRVRGGDTVTATFEVTNVGGRAGADVPQVYISRKPPAKRGCACSDSNA